MGRFVVWRKVLKEPLENSKINDNACSSSNHPLISLFLKFLDLLLLLLLYGKKYLSY